MKEPAQPNISLSMIIEQVAKDKGIDRKILVETLEAAILSAAKRTFGVTREIEARFNGDTGNIDLFQYMVVVEEVTEAEREITVQMAENHGLETEIGEEIGFQIYYRPDEMDLARKQDKEFGDLLRLEQHRAAFGRIAAQTAKQVVIQRIRDAERDNIYNEYKDRKGETITGIVRRFERGNDIIVDLGRTEAILPSREQTPRESYRPGDRIVAYVKDIDRESRGPLIILSRTDVGLLIKLFEMEVPEIYEGIVRIVAAAREPGARSKIAVSSRDSDVDPVGACVGMKGSRVQAVVQELRGERIDIVQFERDPARFVCAAIQPAEVSRVIIDEANGVMELVVPDEKLSLAIGRRGQNVRLASQLTGWRLDIISETKFKQIEEEAIVALATIDGVDDALAHIMYKLGFRSVEEVLDASEQELGAIPGLGGLENVSRIKQSAEAAMERHRQTLISEAANREEPLTERDRLLQVRGVGERTVELLASGGYRAVEDIYGETDVDRLAIKTGVGLKKARQIKQGAKEYIETEAQVIEAARAAAAAKRAEAPPEPPPEEQAPAASTETKELDSGLGEGKG